MSAIVDLHVRHRHHVTEALHIQHNLDDISYYAVILILKAVYLM